MIDRVTNNCPRKIQRLIHGKVKDVFVACKLWKCRTCGPGNVLHHVDIAEDDYRDAFARHTLFHVIMRCADNDPDLLRKTWARFRAAHQHLRYIGIVEITDHGQHFHIIIETTDPAGLSRSWLQCGGQNFDVNPVKDLRQQLLYVIGKRHQLELDGYRARIIRSRNQIATRRVVAPVAAASDYRLPSGVPQGQAQDDATYFSRISAARELLRGTSCTIMIPALPAIEGEQPCTTNN